MSNTNSKYYNPWMDIASYQIDDAFRFKGREEDVEKFLGIINNRTMSVLYAGSGIGKTSFINAGIIPEMKTMSFLPIRVIIPDKVFESGDITVWLYNRFFSLKEENEGRKDNTYYWKSYTDEMIEGCETSLWWLLHTSRIHEHGTNKTYIPFVVFDQFEEIFIKSQKLGERCGKFLEDFFGVIQDMASKVMPNYLHQKLEEKTNKEGRFISIGSAHEYKVIFSLRNEYLSDFDYWTNDKFIVTELYRNRMYLLPLTREQATRVIIEQPNPENEGEQIDTLNEIRDAILDKINGKKDEVEPLMLSVLCSRLYDEATFKGIKHLTKQDVESINMDTLISKFYKDIVSSVITDPWQLYEFEELMVDKDNHRNKVKSSLILGGGFDKEYEIKKNNELAKTSYKKELEDKHIIRIERYNDEDYVELIHDRLCDVVIERRRNEEIRRLNQQRVQDDLNVLTLRGRRLLDNTIDFGAFIHQPFYGSPYFEDCLTYMGESILDFNMRYHHHESVKTSLIGFLSEITGKDDGYSYFEFKDDEGASIKSIDRISKFKIRFKENRDKEGAIESSQQEIYFLDNENKPIYKKGCCGLRLKYDKMRREVWRSYIDSDGKNVRNIDGYSQVKRKYDKFGNLVSVRFYDINDEACPHRNGNYGYNSVFDNLGREIKRMYISKKGKTCSLVSGISGRVFLYEGIDNKIWKEFNINNKGERCTDKEGFCGVEFVYDNQDRIYRETYLDVVGKPMDGKNGYCVTITEYKRLKNGNLEIIERYKDAMGADAMEKIGYFRRKDVYQDGIYLIKEEYLDNRGNLTELKSSKLSYVSFEWNEVGQIKKHTRFGLHNNLIISKWVKLDKFDLFIEQCGDIIGANTGKESGYDTQRGDGEFFVRDPISFLPVAYKHINNNGVFVPDADGVFEHKLVIKEGNVVTERFYDIDGNPKDDKNGAFGYSYEYDNDGNYKTIIVLNSKGVAANNANGYAYIEYEYDAKGRPRYRRTHDKNHTLCPDEVGDYAKKYEYSDFPYTERIISLSRYEKSHNNKEGYCVQLTTKDDQGRIIKQQYIDKDGGFVLVDFQYSYHESTKEYKTEVVRNLDNLGNMVEKEGCAYVIKKYDIMGREVETSIYNIKDELVSDSNGDYCTRYEYSEDGLTTRIICLDGSRSLHDNNKGWAVLERTVDEMGRDTRVVFTNAQGKPAYDEDLGWGVQIIYTDNPNVTIVSKLDETQSPNLSVRIEKDEQKGEEIIQYLNASLNPIGKGTRTSENENLKIITNIDGGCEVVEDENGIAQVFNYYDEEKKHIILEYRLNKKGDLVPYFTECCKIKRDYKNNLEWSECYLDKNDRLCENKDGIAMYYRRINNQGRIVYEMRYNAKGSPAVDSMGDYGEAYEYYDSLGSKKITSLGSSGNPHFNLYGFVSQRIAYTDGVKRQIFLDLSDKPTATINGEFGLEEEKLDEYTIKRTWLDSSLKPAPSKAGYASVIERKNEHGNTTQLLWYDVNGMPFCNDKGDYGVEIEYGQNENGMYKRQTFLNKKGLPHKNRDGYVSVRVELDDAGNEKRRLWYDEDDMPIPNSEGNFGYMVERNVGIPNGSVFSYLDKEGKPQKNREGWTYRLTIDLDKCNSEVWFLDDDMKSPVENRDGDVAYRRKVAEDGSFTFVSLDEYGHPRNNRKNGYAFRMVMQDEKGRITKELWYDVNGIPFCNNNDDYGIITEYDDCNNTQTRKYLGKDGKPHINKLGYAMKRQILDGGRVIQVMWMDENGFPIKNNNSGCCGIRYCYFDKQKMEIKINLDNQESPCEDMLGITSVKAWKDSQGRRIQELYYDINGVPVCDKYGDCGTRYIHTDDSNMIVLVSLNSKGMPHTNKLGYTKEVRIDKKVEVTSIYLDENDKPVDKKEAVLIGVSDDKDDDIVMPEIVLFQATQDGQLKDRHMDGKYILFKYNKWQLGLPLEVLGVEIDKSREKEKHLEFVECINNELSNLGGLISLTFNENMLGGRFMLETVPYETYKTIIHLAKWNKQNNE